MKCSLSSQEQDMYVRNKLYTEIIIFEKSTLKLNLFTMNFVFCERFVISKKQKKYKRFLKSSLNLKQA